MTNDNRPKHDAVVFETMARMQCSMPLTGYDLGVLNAVLSTAVESCEQISRGPALAMMPEQGREAHKAIEDGSRALLSRVNELISYLGVAASTLHAERMDAKQNAPTTSTGQ